MSAKWWGSTDAEVEPMRAKVDNVRTREGMAGLRLRNLQKDWSLDLLLTNTRR